MKKTLLALTLTSLFAMPLFAAETETTAPLKENEIEQLVIKIHEEANQGGYELLSVDELKKLVDGKENLVLIDAHPKDQFNAAFIDGANNFEFQPKFTRHWNTDATGGSEEAYKALLGHDMSKKIVVYCGGNKCGRSHTAALWTKELGYHHVYRMPSGIKGWQDAGYPVKSTK